jgi:hypothetical protein
MTTHTPASAAHPADPTAQPAPDRIPTEFQTYWPKKDSPGLKWAQRVFRTVMGFELLPSEEHALQFAHGYYDADPVAEAFVDEVYAQRGAIQGRRMLDQAIEHGVESIPDPPASMVRLFAEFEQDPDWLDREKAARGAGLFRRFGPSVFSFAGVETLLAYTENSIVKPLALTGGYAGDTALNRFMETSRFWIDVSEADGLRAGGPGRATAMRVRVMHVFIRRGLMKHPEWDLAAWGVPINQSDALITLISSSYTPGLAMHLLGYRNRVADIEAMMHFWRYVGHLLGVQPRWYPADVKEATQLSALFFVKCTHGAVEDGAELVESYPRAFTPKPGTSRRKRIRDEVNYRVQIGYTRYFLPGRFYRRYDMPNPWPWALLAVFQIPLNLALDLLARRSARAASLQDRYARARRTTWFRNEMGNQEAHFKAAEKFRR